MLTTEDFENPERGDMAKRTFSPCRRVSMSVRRAGGFSLLELVITITVMTILTMGVMPLVKVSVRRQREQRLRESLREMRLAIQEFHRDTNGMQCTSQNSEQSEQQQKQQQQQVSSVDPRSRVVITDCKIFTVDNPDRYPPDLQALVDGVNVAPRGGGANVFGGSGLEPGTKTATEINSNLSTKKKVYLRAIPIDPITGEADWEFRSCYDLPDSGSWGKENVFDVRSKAPGTALNGEKYSDW